MKKLKLLVMPLMVIPFLASCANAGGGGGDDPKEKEWYEDTTYISSLTDADVTKEGGEIKTLKVNGLDHKVRLIGVDKDVDSEGNTIHTTWEFADLISDENGFSLATYWNNIDGDDKVNHDYKESTLRKALIGTTNDINWFRYYGAEHDTDTNRSFAKENNYKISVLDMINNENEGFKDALKAPSKFINIWNDEKQPNAGWDEETINDKLFLLSPAEMGREGHQDEEPSTTTYPYYANTAQDDKGEPKRVKLQINRNEGARTAPLQGIDIEGAFTSGKKYSFAGFNHMSADYGGSLWLRSPVTYNNDLPWCCSYAGVIHSDWNGNTYTAAVAPAFCI